MKSDDGAMRVRTTEQKGINVKGLDLWGGRPIHLDSSYLQIQTQVSKPIEANPQTQESSVKVSQCQRVHHSTSNLVCG